MFSLLGECLGSILVRELKTRKPSRSTKKKSGRESSSSAYISLEVLVLQRPTVMFRDPHHLLDTITSPTSQTLLLQHLAGSLPAASSCLLTCDLCSLYLCFSLHRPYFCFFCREGLSIFPFPRSHLAGLEENLSPPGPLSVRSWESTQHRTDYLDESHPFYPSFIQHTL